MTTLPTLLGVLILMQTSELRPDIDETINKSRAMMGDFEEKQALAALDAVAARKDITSVEFAAVQFWRGAALMSLNQEKEAGKAFALARACDGLLTAPAGLSPKIARAFSSSVPGDCPIGATPPPDPTENLMPAPTAKPVEKRAPVKLVAAEESSGGGLPILALAGAGVAAAGGASLLLALVGGLGAAGLIGGSFPVRDAAQNAERAKDVRQQGMIAFGMLVGGLGGFLGVGLLVLTGIGAVAVGAGAAAWGVMSR